MIQISPRERLLSVGLIVGIAAWALYGLAIRPAQDRIRTLQRVIPEKQDQLKQLQAKSAQYTALRNQLDQLQTNRAAQEPDFQLLPFLETLTERKKLAGHVSMEPDLLQAGSAEIGVTIELHDISLKDLIDFLTDVETSKSMVRVGSLHIRKSPKNEALLDSTVGIRSPKLSPPALTTQAAQ